jgi:methionyl-tRNA synthetase
VHTGTVVANEWLWHEGRRFSVSVRNVVDAILQYLHFCY